MGQAKLLVETSVISNLPEIVKKEVLYPSVKDTEKGREERQKIAMRLISAFQISFPKLEGIDYENGVKPMEMAVGEFGAYLKAFPYHLTGEEILEAYRMASRGELLDFLGKQIQFFPNLQTAQAGRILMAYQDFKIGNQQHTIGIQKLKKILTPTAEPTPEESKALKLQNWENLLDSVKKGIPCAHAFLFYEFAVKKGGFKNFIKNNNAQVFLVRKKMQSIIWEEKKKVKSATFNNFEITHLIDYFKTDLLYNQAQFAFERLKAMALVQVKNELVYNWLKKELRKNEAANKKPNSNLPEESKREKASKNEI